VSAEPLRLLHQRSQYAYTTSIAEALVDEPEAVSADWQMALTHRAQLGAEDRARRARIERRDELARVIAWAGELHLHDAGRELRAVRHALARLDRRLAL